MSTYFAYLTIKRTIIYTTIYLTAHLLVFYATFIYFIRINLDEFAYRTQNTNFSCAMLSTNITPFGEDWMGPLGQVDDIYPRLECQ